MIFKTYKSFLIILLACLLSACGKQTKKEKAGFDLYISQITYNKVILPIGAFTNKEIYVVNSYPVSPGRLVDIINNDSQEAIITKAKALNVRWSVPGPFQLPKYPATGFIRLSLAKNQWEALEKVTNIAIIPTTVGVHRVPNVKK